MPRHKESFGELLLKLPWWVSALLGLLAFAGLRWGPPVWAANDSSRQIIAKPIAQAAPLPLLIFAAFALGSLWFAKSRRRLVDGPQLLALVQSVQATPAIPGSAAIPIPAPAEPAAPPCPQCGKPMVQRVARRGSNTGNFFWGCSGYPACKGIIT